MGQGIESIMYTKNRNGDHISNKTELRNGLIQYDGYLYGTFPFTIFQDKGGNISPFSEMDLFQRNIIKQEPLKSDLLDCIRYFESYNNK